MAYMTIARADKQDFDTTNAFMQAAESVLEKQKFSFLSPSESWEDWDDYDEDKKLIIKIRSRIAKEENCEEEEVDNRILCYEFLKDKFRHASCNWRRVHWAADAWERYAQDPQKDILHFAPQFEQYHVAPEQ